MSETSDVDGPCAIGSPALQGMGPRSGNLVGFEDPKPIDPIRLERREGAIRPVALVEPIDPLASDATRFDHYDRRTPQAGFASQASASR